MQGFETLFTAAQDLNLAPGWQAVVVQTARGALHCFAGYALDGQDRISEDLVKTLTETQDPVIVKLLCQWDNGCIDLPHIQLRRTLLALDPNNADTQILLQGSDELRIYRLLDRL